MPHMAMYVNSKSQDHSNITVMKMTQYCWSYKVDYGHSKLILYDTALLVL